jgi:acetyl-CoA carboxylase carboxyl transferase subunit beta
LKFENYKERLDLAVRKAGPLEGVRTGYARLDGMPLDLGVMDFSFMGGSMGSVVGEKIARLTRRSAEKGIPLLIVSTSGGARMQEGVLSLMQMAKTSVEIARLQRAGVPFISVLTNPTTGGVSASFAMQGDVILAEPGAVVGFAGPRVIKQTIGQDLPEGFQTAEFLLEHGMVDAVVSRSELRGAAARLLRHMAGRQPVEATD